MPSSSAPLSVDTASGTDARATPSIEQFIEIKTANPDCLLFFRMGDFYEMLFEDAEIASRAVGLTLTKRGKHLGKDIPLCGVPVKQAENYLQRLITAGYRIAVAEQMEDAAEAKKRGYKAVVRRDVVRLITPGTLFEDDLLEPRRANNLVVVSRSGADEGERFGLATVDLSTGSFLLNETDRKGLAAELARLEPAELAAAENLLHDEELKPHFMQSGASLSPLGHNLTDDASAERRLKEAFAVHGMEGLGSFTPAELAAAATAVSYVARTQRSETVPLQFPSRTAQGGFLEIDAATRANLEITRTLGGQRNGSVLNVIDRTITAAGARLLMERISSPLTDVGAITARHDAVGYFFDNPALRRDVREALKGMPDLSRALQRLALQRGGPRDLAGIALGLNRTRQIAQTIAASSQNQLPFELEAALMAALATDTDLCAELEKALAEELPLRTSDGGFIRSGFSADLDEQRSLRDDSRRVIIDIQNRYAQETEAKTLRIKHTNFLGYFVEVPPDMGEALRQPPHNSTFIHRQTLQNAMRFSTTELAELETRIAAAADRSLAIEKSLFDDFSSRILEASQPIKQAAHALAILDVTAALAELAVECSYVRPTLDTSLAFSIEKGRHPVVEQATQKGKFVANDCNLSAMPQSPESGRLWLLTGPNMAGKSTFLRQNALIVLLAQAGSFVPAASAHFGVVDRLFSRVGAADDLARGRSTFMVEMVETAAILNQATARSLVILDEIGRGTSTFDGLSIAWATLEHLHDATRCRTLFATHYHELTHLASRLPRLHNATVKVAEWKGEVVFLHEVIAGAADRSYGIQVARLAGLPDKVVGRAKVILKELEKTDRSAPVVQMLDGLPLFALEAAESPPAKEATAPIIVPHPVLDELGSIKPDELTPRDALDILYRLKSMT